MKVLLAVHDASYHAPNGSYWTWHHPELMIDELNRFYYRVAAQSHPNNSESLAHLQPGFQFAVIDESRSCYYRFVEAGYDTKGRPGRFVLLCGFVRSSTGHPSTQVMSRLYESHTIQEIVRSCSLTPVPVPAEQAIDLNSDEAGFTEGVDRTLAPADVLHLPAKMNIPLDRVPSESMLDSEPIHVGNSRGNSWPSRGSNTRSSVVNNTTMADRNRNVASDATGQVTSLRRPRATNLLLTMVLLSIVVVLCVRLYFVNPGENGLRQGEVTQLNGDLSKNQPLMVESSVRDPIQIEVNRFNGVRSVTRAIRVEPSRDSFDMKFDWAMWWPIVFVTLLLGIMIGYGIGSRGARRSRGDSDGSRGRSQRTD